MQGLHIPHLREHVVRPTLEYLNMHSSAAENLLIGTALTESRLVYLHQLGNGPAKGIYQMEPDTYNDIYLNYLDYRPGLKKLVDDLRDQRPTTHEEEVIYNLAFATALCRIHYRRVPEALPGNLDALGMACYWKNYFNSSLGAGTIEKALPYFERACKTQ